MLRTLFLLAIVVPGIAAAFFSPFAALLVYLWYAFFRPDAWVWVDISGLRLSMLLGALLIGRCAASGVLPDVRHPLSAATLLFLGTALLAQMGAVNQESGWFWINYFGRLVLMCLLAVSLVNTPKRLVIVLAVISASYGFHTAKAGVASLLGGGVRFSNGTAGAFGDNNEYAIGAAMMMGVLIAAAQNLDHRWAKRGFLAAAPLTALTIVSTFSRAGLLGLLTWLVTFVTLQRRRVAALCAMAAVATVAYLFVPLPSGYLDRMRTIQTYEQVEDRSALGRLHFWHVALAMVSDHPLGVGLRNFEDNYDRYDTSEGLFGPRRAVHSSHFQVLAELGYIGAALWVGLFAYAFVLGLRIRARARRPGLTPADSRFLFTTSNALLTSMAAFLVGGSFIALAINEMTWLTFALLAALDRISLDLCASAAPVTVTAHVVAPRFLRPDAAHAAVGHVADPVP